MVDEFPQAQVPGEGGRQEQAGIGHQAMVVKGCGYGRDCSVAAQGFLHCLGEVALLL